MPFSHEFVRASARRIASARKEAEARFGSLRLTLVIIAVLAVAAPPFAAAAPPLQLPWPTGQTHYIWQGANGYGCGTHTGRDQYAIDFQLSPGQPVSAVAAGIANVGDQGGSGYGRYVWVDHGGGLISLYAHLSSVSVSSGQAVGQGQTLGGAGSTGNSTGTHLHFAMRAGASGLTSGSAFRPEPMSGYSGFGAYGGCAGGRSPNYTSGPPSGGSISDGSFVSAPDGRVYRVAGGAPIYVSSWNAVGGPQPVTNISFQQLDAMRPVPADGTFIRTSQDGAVYRVAGGAPIYVSTWDTYGGPQPSVDVDKWAVDNIANPAAHLRPVPADGTLVRGLPSQTLWEFRDGLRHPGGASGDGVDVDDAGLAKFLVFVPPPSSVDEPVVDPPPPANGVDSRPPGGNEPQPGRTPSPSARLGRRALIDLLQRTRLVQTSRLRRRPSIQLIFTSQTSGLLRVKWTTAGPRKPRLLAAGARRFPRAGTYAVTIRLTRAGRRGVARVRRLRLASSVTFVPRGESAQIATKEFRLRR